MLPQLLDSNNDTNFTLRTKRNTTSTLNHIDNNAQQTQHEPHSGTNYHDKNQYNNTANTQDTTKSTHARTPNTNTKSAKTETTLAYNTKHTKQIHTQTGHKHNALDQSKQTYEIGTKVSNGLNAMSIPNEKAYVTKKRQNQKQRQQRLTLTDSFRTQKNKRQYKLDKGTLARTSYIWE